VHVDNKKYKSKKRPYFMKIIVKKQNKRDAKIKKIMHKKRYRKLTRKRRR